MACMPATGFCLIMSLQSEERHLLQEKITRALARINQGLQRKALYR